MPLKSFLPIKLLVLASLVAGFCPSARANVFGRDDRYVIVDRQVLPGNAIARLSYPGAPFKVCSGFFVGRSDVFVTAGHCVLNRDGTARDFTIHVGEINGKELVTIPVGARERESLVLGGNIFSATGGTGRAAKEIFRNVYANDWAILPLQLDPDTQAKIGHFDVRSQAQLNLPALSSEALLLAGFSVEYFENGRTDQTATVSIPCSIRRDAGQLYFHDCDGLDGNSGGPLFYYSLDVATQALTPTVMGIHVGDLVSKSFPDQMVPEYSHDFANFAVKSDAFLPTLEKIIALKQAEPLASEAPLRTTSAPN